MLAAVVVRVHRDDAPDDAGAIAFCDDVGAARHVIYAGSPCASSHFRASSGLSKIASRLYASASA